MFKFRTNLSRYLLIAFVAAILIICLFQFNVFKEGYTDAELEAMPEYPDIPSDERGTQFKSSIDACSWAIEPEKIKNAKGKMVDNPSKKWRGPRIGNSAPGWAPYEGTIEVKNGKGILTCKNTNFPNNKDLNKKFKISNIVNPPYGIYRWKVIGSANDTDKDIAREFTNR